MKKSTKTMLSTLCAVSMMFCLASCANETAANETVVEESSNTLHVLTQEATPSPDWFLELPEASDESVDQVFVVAAMGMDKTTATVSLHERDEQGNWMQVLSTPGYVGMNGLCLDEDHAEGVGQTPVGRYHFNCAFGIAQDPGSVMPYTQVTDDDYWSGDPDYHYNEMVNINDYPELALDDSEHLVDYDCHYQYCLNISFNEEGTPGRGSAIFLHCFGPQWPFTGGCVSVPEYDMIEILRRVDENCVVVIDTAETLNIEVPS